MRRFADRAMTRSTRLQQAGTSFRDSSARPRVRQPRVAGQEQPRRHRRAEPDGRDRSTGEACTGRLQKGPGNGFPQPTRVRKCQQIELESRRPLKPVTPASAWRGSLAQPACPKRASAHGHAANAWAPGARQRSCARSRLRRTRRSWSVKRRPTRARRRRPGAKPVQPVRPRGSPHDDRDHGPAPRAPGLATPA